MAVKRIGERCFQNTLTKSPGVSHRRISRCASTACWLEEDSESVAKRYRNGELGQLDVIRRYGVILDWGTGELFPKTTEQFRAMLQTRMVPHWAEAAAV